MCKYCNEAVALTIGRTDDRGIAIKYPNWLIAYGYDVSGFGSNGLAVRINYCPMCGRKLPGEKVKVKNIKKPKQSESSGWDNPPRFDSMEQRDLYYK